MSSPPAIRLETLRPDHAPAMFDGMADPAGYVFLPGEPPVDVAALRGLYERQAVGHSADGLETWLNWVVRRCGDGTILGCTQATIRGAVADLGYQIFPVFWRQGVATAALWATIDQLFASTAIDEIHGLVDTRNVASVALLRKLGFDCLRTIADADHFKGASSDEHEFVLRRPSPAAPA